MANAFNIIDLPDRKRTVKETVAAAVAQNPRVLITIGINENGEEFYHCSAASPETLLWLLERAKARLIGS